jgi:hypothetical protein
MPLDATERMNHFWNNKKIISEGIVTIEAKAKMSPHTFGSWLKNC